VPPESGAVIFDRTPQLALPKLSTLARKFGDVFCWDQAAIGRVASLSRSASRSRRVKRHWNGLATAW